MNSSDNEELIDIISKAYTAKGKERIALAMEANSVKCLIENPQLWKDFMDLAD